MADRATLADLFPAEPARRPAGIIPQNGPQLSQAPLARPIAEPAEPLRGGGIGPGDPVAIVLGNNLEYLATFLATTWARAVAAPLNPAYKTEEFKYYLEDAGAKAVIVAPGDHPARAAAAQL